MISIPIDKLSVSIPERLLLRISGICLWGMLLLLAFMSHPSGIKAQSTESDSAEIRKQLEQRNQQIKDLLGPKGKEYSQKQRDKLKDLINNIVDYRSMAQRALQTTFDTLSSKKREKFVDLFSRVVRDQSLNKLDIYRAEIKYEKISVAGDSAYVETTARLEDTRTPVNYRMREEENRWVITDIIIDEVSTVASYRRSFQNIIQKKGYDALVKTLQKRVNE